MTQDPWSVYRIGDGVFTGRVVRCAAGLVSMNLREGEAAMRGEVDRDRWCVVDGVLAEYQPAMPDDDGGRLAWSWDAVAWQWRSELTDIARAESVRAERDRRLSACDWTQLPDVPQSTAAVWLVYRQALRDMTSQAGFPGAVVWPTEPQQGGQTAND